MRLAVRYLAQLRHAAGVSGEEVDVRGPVCVRDFLVWLADRHPRLRHSVLTADGGVQPTVLVFLGDEQVRAEHDLCDGDVVTLLTPVAGGGPDADRTADL